MTSIQRMRAAASVVCFISVFVAGCGSGESSRQAISSSTVDAPLAFQGHVLIPRRVRPGPGKARSLVSVQWRVMDVRHGNEVELHSERGYCADREAPPKFEEVSVDYRGKNVYLTAYVPARRVAVRGTICEGIGYSEFGVVRLARPVKRLRLLDGSTTPPAVRWPSAG